MDKLNLSGLDAALKQSEVVGYDEAWSMPKSYYTDPKLLDIEREQLFGKEWICIGRSEEINNGGDYMTFQLCDEPLVAVRGEDGKIRVLSNVCRHRGALLAEGRGNRHRLVCPYHHWSYDLEGKLAGAPRMADHKSFKSRNAGYHNFHVRNGRASSSQIFPAILHRWHQVLRG